MEATDRMLVCRTCGKDFPFTVRDQEFFASKGFAEPRHCQECRAQRKRESSAESGEHQPGQFTSIPRDRTDREWTEVECVACGKPANVPFRPTTGRPVYCRDCFAKQRRGEELPSSPQARTAPPPSQPRPADQIVRNPAPAKLVIPPDWEDDLGPLPDFDPAPDEEGEIAQADFIPFSSTYGATPEEIDPKFSDEDDLNSPPLQR